MHLLALTHCIRRQRSSCLLLQKPLPRWYYTDVTAHAALYHSTHSKNPYCKCPRRVGSNYAHGESLLQMPKPCWFQRRTLRISCLLLQMPMPYWSMRRTHTHINVGKELHDQDLQVQWSSRLILVTGPACSCSGFGHVSAQAFARVCNEPSLLAPIVSSHLEILSCSSVVLLYVCIQVAH